MDRATRARLGSARGASRRAEVVLRDPPKPSGIAPVAGMVLGALRSEYLSD